jgi:16S rRNA (adenine1518-N6/adenine1519-N6)-dimethyltransferase
MLHVPRKRFGQNFLHNQHIITDILRALNPQAEDNLIEIGPGLGALTLPLLHKQLKFTAIEIDRDLYKYWLSLPAAQNNLTLINQDALTVDYASLGNSLRIFGNLPYNISTPLLIGFLRQINVIQDLHFMLQKEVVERLAASPGNKIYGRLSVMAQAFCDVEHLFDVPPTAFEPQPKVDSAVVRLTPRPILPNIKFENLERVVACAFAMRRKTLANNLKKMFTADTLLDLGIDATLRPEQISVMDYIKLAAF